MQRLAAFAVNANNVLVARDDTRLDGGDAARVGDDAFVGNIRGAQVFAQRLAGFVDWSFTWADHSKQFHAGAKRGEIGCNISGAAKALALLDIIDNRNGSFGRKARSGSPKIAIEHQVADDSDALAAQARDETLQSGGGVSEVSRQVRHELGRSSALFRVLFATDVAIYSGALVAWSMISTGISSRIG